MNAIPKAVICADCQEDEALPGEDFCRTCMEAYCEWCGAALERHERKVCDTCSDGDWR